MVQCESMRVTVVMLLVSVKTGWCYNSYMILFLNFFSFLFSFFFFALMLI